MVASQMAAAIYDQTSIAVRAKSKGQRAKGAGRRAEGEERSARGAGAKGKGQSAKLYALSAKPDYLLRARGSVMKFLGWKIVYDSSTKHQAPNSKQIQNSNVQNSRHSLRDNSQTAYSAVSKAGSYGGQAKPGEEVVLPKVEEGEGLKYKDLSVEQKFTKPPSRYNDASLVKELEKRGIGRPSTYAPIIDTLIGRGYVERKERRFYPSKVAATVVKFLGKHFEQVMDYDFTAEMEEDLDRIARGEKEWRKVMGSFYKPFIKKVKKVEKDVKRVEIPVEKTGEKCPTCKKGEVIIREGRFGKFYSCSTFPECKYTANYTEKLDNFPCPDCKGDVVIKRTRKGRSFFGCNNYPKCKWASWKDPRRQK
jgi:DNA topoisomerase IA